MLTVTERPFGPNAPPRPAAYTLIGLAILVLCWIQFTGAWVWAPTRSVEWGVIETYDDKPGAVLLQYPLWLLILLGFGLAVFKQGMAVVRQLLPFGILLGVMLAASVFGLSMAASARVTVLWLLSVLAGAAVASLLDREVLFKGLAAVILATMAASLLSYFLTPDYGSDRYFDRLVLRGLYQHKNTAGRIAALALTLVFVVRNELPRGLRYAALAASASCLLLSESKTAWLSAVLTIAFLQLLHVLRNRVTAGLGVVITGSIVALGILLVLVSAPLLAEAFGRDLTLTGRTSIWAAYLAEIKDVMWLGAGPGNVTTPSPFTAKLALGLRAYGSIFTPHSFYIGTLGDLGVLGLVYTLALFAYLTLWLPLHDRGPFTISTAAVGAATLIGGLGETLDAAAPGSTWFLMSLGWIGYCRQRLGTDSSEAPVWPRPLGTAGAAGDQASTIRPG